MTWRTVLSPHLSLSTLDSRTLLRTHSTRIEREFVAAADHFLFSLGRYPGIPSATYVTSPPLIPFNQNQRSQHFYRGAPIRGHAERLPGPPGGPAAVHAFNLSRERVQRSLPSLRTRGLALSTAKHEARKTYRRRDLNP